MAERKMKFDYDEKKVMRIISGASAAGEAGK